MIEEWQCTGLLVMKGGIRVPENTVYRFWRDRESKRGEKLSKEILESLAEGMRGE